MLKLQDTAKDTRRAPLINPPNQTLRERRRGVGPRASATPPSVSVRLAHSERDRPVAAMRVKHAACCGAPAGVDTTHGNEERSAKRPKRTDPIDVVEYSQQLYKMVRSTRVLGTVPLKHSR